MQHQSILRKGSRINSGKPVSFYFEGRIYKGFEGDTIASALAASGVWVLSRSFKYHRPRGILTMAGQDSNTLVQIGQEPSVLADRHPISDGLDVRPMNVNGRLAKDRDFFVNRLSRFLPVGFYYRSFFRPRFAWEKIWEPLFRAKTGLGKIDPSTVEAEYCDKTYGWHDVIVVGAGPAGLAAALSAADAGADVLLLDENPVIGGALSYARFGESIDEAKLLLDRVAANKRITVWTDATCNGWFADNWLPVIRGNRLWKLRARQVVLACGMIEQPAQFRNNDLPGIMQGTAAQRLIREFGVSPGSRAVVLAANDDAYGVALDLIESGSDVAAVVDFRRAPADAPFRAELQRRGVPIHDESCIYEAAGTDGLMHVSAAVISAIGANGQAQGPKSRIDCDLICMSIGYTPAYQLAIQAGGRISYDDTKATFSIGGQSPDVLLAGSLDGYYSLSACLRHGAHQGSLAAARCGFGDMPSHPPVRDRESLNHAWPIIEHPEGKNFVDFDEDLQVADIVNAVADGYRELELVKRFSTVGMGPSQGRHAALATARLVARTTQRSVAEVGVTTARPPVSGERLDVLAGRTFVPKRQTPMHQRHVEAGAEFLLAGAWARPAHYARGGDAEEQIRREVLNARNNVGLIDVSTLGGLDVRGPDAAEFLDRMYTFTYSKLPVGRTRYLLMTNEAGSVIDDGVACRLAEKYFYVTATTSGVDRVYRNMLWWNAQWRMDVDIANVTAAYAALNLAGPNARKVMESLTDEIDVSPEGFPYLAFRAGRVANIPARVFRVGFIGEVGYEIHVPARFGLALWDAAMEAGRTFDISPFGVEAQRLMRLEKGHVIVGQDTDAMTTPAEIDMGWAVATKKPYFVGKRSLTMRGATAPRRKLVGFTLESMPAAGLVESNLVVEGGDIKGFITSVAHSPNLRRVIGLAYVPFEKSAIGSEITLRASDGSLHQAGVVAPHFYDPENKRQEM